MTPPARFLDGPPPETRGAWRVDAYVDFARALRNQPRRWGEFNPAARWDDWDTVDERNRSRRLGYLRGQMNRGSGSFDGPGNFEATVRDGRLYARWTA